MHSSRMRTGRSLTVCCSLLLGGVCLVGGWSAWSWGGFLPAQGWGGVCLVGGGSPCLGVVCLVPGGEGGFSLPRREWGGVSAWSRGGLSLPGGICLVPGGSPCPRGAARRPPVNRITDTCKNITLATTSLRPVKMKVGAENILVLAPLTSVRCICAVIVVSRPLS